MNWFKRTFSYSIGKKVLMSVSGLFLLLFLIVHVSGNFLLFKGDGGVAFNEYSHIMTTNPIIMIVEVGTFMFFFLHIIDGIMLWLKNRGSRPTRYAKTAASSNTSWSSRNIIVTGALILLFLIIHLKTFFVPYRIEGSVPNLFELTKEAFQSPLYVAFYVFSMVLLGLHLHHGIASAFQTLGLRHPNYYSFVKGMGVVLSIIICGGFASMPLYFFFDKIFN